MQVFFTLIHTHRHTNTHSRIVPNIWAVTAVFTSVGMTRGQGIIRVLVVVLVVIDFLVDTFYSCYSVFFSACDIAGSKIFFQ